MPDWYFEREMWHLDGSVDAPAAHRPAGQLHELADLPQYGWRQEASRQPSHPATPRVDVVLATNRNLPYLAEALQSLREQDYQNWGLIAVLDGVPDPEADLVKRQLRRAVPDVQVYDQPRLGVAAARNLGLSYAAGELVVFMDDDDIWATPKLSRQVQLLAGQPELVGCLHACELIGPSGQLLGQQIGGPLDRDVLFEVRSDGWCGGAFMVRRQIAIACGGYSTAYTVCEDLAFVLELVERGPIGWDPQPLIKYRKHPAGQTANQTRMVRTTLQIYRDRLARALALQDERGAQQLTNTVICLQEWLAEPEPS